MPTWYCGWSAADLARAKERRRLESMTFHERKAERIAKAKKARAS